LFLLRPPFGVLLHEAIDPAVHAARHLPALDLGLAAVEGGRRGIELEQPSSKRQKAGAA
jgi:hypothetical protein